MKLRIATWNINSLRLRVSLLKELIGALDPDVICLQETKVPALTAPAVRTYNVMLMENPPRRRRADRGVSFSLSLIFS